MRKNKTLLTIILIAVFCVILAFSASAETDKGSCGNDAEWSFDSGSGTLTISGTGSMYNYTNYSDLPWQSYKSLIKHIEIENGITEIGQSAFNECSAVETVTTPATLVKINDYAFRYCSSLKSVTLPSDNSLEYIGSSCFRGCTALEAFSIPKTITEIQSYSFYNCSAMTKLTLHSEITAINEFAFYNCLSLKSFIAGDSSKLLTVREGAFQNCISMTTIDFGKDSKIVSIGKYAFYNCADVTALDIPQSVKAIGIGAFGNCSALIYAKLPFLGESATSTTNTNFGYIFGSNLPVDNGTYVPKGLETVIVFGECQIGNAAFLNCTSLKTVALLSGVTRISDNSFFGCKALESIIIANTVTEIGEKAFGSCISLKAIEIPAAVTKIGFKAFEGCKILESIGLSKGLLSISDKAFYDCTSLKSVYIPMSVNTIGLRAFAYYDKDDEKRLENFKILCYPLSTAQQYAENNGIDYSYTCKDAEHIEGVWETLMPSTCTQAGLIIKKCNVCGEIIDKKESKPIPHDYIGDVVLPTCATGGYTTFTCKDCKESYIGAYTEKTGIHIWSEWSETKAPNCTENGQKFRFCPVCYSAGIETVEYSAIEAGGHTPSGEWVTDKAPTCTEAGTRTQKCKICGETAISEQLPATGHNFTAPPLRVEPNCTEKGYISIACLNSGCGEAQVTVINARGHSESDWKTELLPTCTQPGKAYTDCGVCGEKLNTKTVDALGHQYIKQTVKPTCTADGYDVFTCAACKSSYKSGTVIATGHDFKEIAVVAPNCIEPGYTKFKCKLCDAEKESNYVYARGHVYDAKVTEPTCLVGGFTAYVCSVCGFESYRGLRTEALGHDFGSWKTKVEPTTESEGVNERVCSRCALSETKPIAKLTAPSETNPPETQKPSEPEPVIQQSTTKLVIIITIIVVGTSGIAAVFIYLIKKKSEK